MEMPSVLFILKDNVLLTNRIGLTVQMNSSKVSLLKQLESKAMLLPNFRCFTFAATFKQTPSEEEGPLKAKI